VWPLKKAQGTAVLVLNKGGLFAPKTEV
jgi:hypothetical protein